MQICLASTVRWCIATIQKTSLPNREPALAMSPDEAKRPQKMSAFEPQALGSEREVRDERTYAAK